ncbi:MAG: VOC family protein [Xenococcaceae cyanobacterium MO_188.B32]|nr:VOC family protein [Xenococcaceae cyanobacterium MO_188.B32]
MNQQTFLNSINPLIPGGEDLEKTVAFYEQQLGFECIHQEGNPIHMAVVKRDSVQIFLLKNRDKHLAEGTSLRINVNQIEKLYAEFQARDGEMIHPNGKLETKPWGMKEFVVLDPARVCLTFCEPANQDTIEVKN